MPSKQKPDAIAVLKEDHRKVEKLFESEVPEITSHKNHMGR